MTTLPRDANHDTIQALRLKEGGSHQVNAIASSAQNTTAFDEDTRVVSVYATQDIYVAFGSDAVTATTADHFFPAGIYYDFSISGGDERHTHIAVLAASDDGTVYISEKH